MSPKVAELFEQARQLTTDERRELAIDLLEAASDPAIEQAWTEEIHRRNSGRPASGGSAPIATSA